MKRKDKVVIYTDGACRRNPGPGGWGAVLLFKEHRREISGGDKETTNNRMELTAAIKALEMLNRPVEVDLFTDSNYLVMGMTIWIVDWQRRGWKRSGGPVKNIDLWRRLVELAEIHRINWLWIKGHAGHSLNERADQLATEAVPE